MAFGVLGFPLVVLAAIGNMALAAVPVIYTNVHFCAAVFTEKQAGQRVDFPVPVGAFDGCVFQNPLYGFKIAAADNRLMHIFCDVPLASVYIVVVLVPEMLCGLEIDNIKKCSKSCPRLTRFFLNGKSKTSPTASLFHDSLLRCDV